MPKAKLWTERFPGRDLKRLSLGDCLHFEREEEAKLRAAKEALRKGGSSTKDAYLEALHRMIEVYQQELTFVSPDCDRGKDIVNSRNRLLGEKEGLQLAP